VKVQGSQLITASVERVYDLLLDPAVLASCIPGCQELVESEPGVYKMKMRVALAAVTGDFTGTVKIADAVRPASFRMLVDGAGRIGHLKGDGLIKLAEAGDSTQIDYEGDVQVGGTMAAIGQRLIDATSRMIIRNFFSNLGRRAQSA
jgi:uncharacterized protein